MPLTQDQHPVEQLTTYGADPAFGERIRSRRTHRCPQDSDALEAKIASKVSVNFASRSRMRNVNLTCSVWSAKSMSRLRACWATHAPVGFAVTPKTRTGGSTAPSCTMPTGAEQDRVDMKQVARHHPLGLRRQELSPRQPRAAGCRVDAGPLENQPHGTRRDRVPEPGEFTLDASVSPRSVLQLPSAGSGDLAPAPSMVDRAGGEAGSSASDEVPMPAQQRPRGHESMVSALSGEQPRARSGPVRPGGSRPGDLSAQDRDLVP